MAAEFKGYTPSSERRFHISSDPISQQRYEIVKRVARDLHALPFYRELTLKGSLSKGKILTDATETTTDIDLGCVLDANAVTNLPDDELTQLCDAQGINRENIDPSPVQVTESNFNIFESDEISPQILSRIRAAQEVTERVIERQTTAHSVNLGLKSPRAEPIVFFIAEEGPFSILSTLSHYEAVHHESPNDNWRARVGATRALALPFGMTIGDGLIPYRKAFFSQLQKLDPLIAEQKWQSVRKALIHNERQENISPAIDNEYPKTLEEAIKMYAA